MYVVYQIPQGTPGQPTATLREAKQVVIPGRMANWEVGEFDQPEGPKIPGVRINYTQHETGSVHRVEAQIVPIPANATEVMVIEGDLPAGYNRAPGEAAS